MVFFCVKTRKEGGIVPANNEKRRQSCVAKSKLMKISYTDTKGGIRLACYADTVVFRSGPNNAKTLAAIRFGGYVEQVRGMCDAIYGGGSVNVEAPSGTLRMDSLTKQYARQMSNDGVYAEATMTAVDDEALAKSRDAEDEQVDGQEQIDLPPRTYYIFCPAGDDNRLFEELDRKVSTPLIPEFKDYLLGALKSRDILVPLTVLTCSMKFDAWALICSQDDKNIAQALEDGLCSGAISISGAAKGNTAAKAQKLLCLRARGEVQLGVGESP